MYAPETSLASPWGGSSRKLERIEALERALKEEMENRRVQENTLRDELENGRIQTEANKRLFLRVLEAQNRKHLDSMQKLKDDYKAFTDLVYESLGKLEDHLQKQKRAFEDFRMIHDLSFKGEIPRLDREMQILTEDMSMQRVFDDSTRELVREIRKDVDALMAQKRRVRQPPSLPAITEVDAYLFMAPGSRSALQPLYKNPQSDQDDQPECHARS